MKRPILSFLSLALAILLVAQTEGFVVTYDDAFSGELTASGDFFSQNLLTAAHETLPLGTEVEILYVQTGKRVTVKINDRIYNAPDLFWISRSAADSLGIQSIFTTEILFTVIGDVPFSEPSPVYQELFASLGPNLEKPAGDSRTPGTNVKEASAFAVQVHTFDKRSDALTLTRRIQDHFEYLSYFEKVTVDNKTLYRVIIGDFHSLDDALDCYWKLRPDLPDIFLIEVQ